jgi:hypothetical protein
MKPRRSTKLSQSIKPKHGYFLYTREVAILVNSIQTAGSHRIEFYGRHIASGVYFYRLENAGSTITKKIVLLK